MDKIGIILLAAGASTRYDDFPKQLLQFQNKTLINHAIEQALGSSAHLLCVVLGANSEIIINEIKDLKVDISVNENWEDGMSSSIKCGLNHLLKIEPNLSAIVLQLCDQPFITKQIMDFLIKTHTETQKPIIASKYEQTFGVPALFHKTFFTELLKLNNQTGAKKIIAKHIGETEFVEIPEAVFDIDTRQDYERLIKSSSEN